MHVYEVRPRSDKRGVDLISDILPFGKLWYMEVSDAIGYVEHRSRSHNAVIRVYDSAGNLIDTHEHNGEFKELSELNIAYSRTHDHSSMAVASSDLVSTHFDVDATQKRAPQRNQITRKPALSNFANWILRFLPHSRFNNG